MTITSHSVQLKKKENPDKQTNNHSNQTASNSVSQSSSHFVIESESAFCSLNMSNSTLDKLIKIIINNASTHCFKQQQQ